MSLEGLESPIPIPIPNPDPEPEPDPDLPEGVDYVSYWYKPSMCGTIYSGSTPGVNPNTRCTAEIDTSSDAGPYPHTLHVCQTTRDMNDYPCSRNDGRPGQTSDTSIWNIKDGDGNFIGNNQVLCGRLFAGTTGGTFCVERMVGILPILLHTSTNTEQPSNLIFITQELHPLGLGANKRHCAHPNPEQPRPLVASPTITRARAPIRARTGTRSASAEP